METKKCNKCGQELPLSFFNKSTSKYIVGGYVKAIHESIRNSCRDCQHPKGWHLKYRKNNAVKTLAGEYIKI